MIGELLCPGQRQRRECLERKHSDGAMGQEARLWESPFRKGFITENPDKVECISLILSGFSCSSVHFFGRRSLKMIFRLCKGIPAQRGRAFLLQTLPQNGLNPAAEYTLYIWIFRYSEIPLCSPFWRGFRFGLEEVPWKNRCASTGAVRFRPAKSAGSSVQIA